MRGSLGRVYTVTLPSGSVVRVRRPSIRTLIASGEIPAVLSSEVLRMQEAVQEKEKTPDEVVVMLTYADKLLGYVLVSPSVAPETNVTVGDDGVLAGTVALVDIADDDKDWLWNFAHRLARAPEEKEELGLLDQLRKFRDDAAGAPAGQGGPAVQGEAVGDAGR